MLFLELFFRIQCPMTVLKSLGGGCIEVLSSKRLIRYATKIAENVFLRRKIAVETIKSFIEKIENLLKMKIPTLFSLAAGTEVSILEKKREN